MRNFGKYGFLLIGTQAFSVIKTTKQKNKNIWTNIFLKGSGLKY
jgi:hypothetical protein